MQLTLWQTLFWSAQVSQAPLPALKKRQTSSRGSPWKASGSFLDHGDHAVWIRGLPERQTGVEITYFIVIEKTGVKIALPTGKWAS